MSVAGDVAPVDISHPRLFAPRREPLEAQAEPSSAARQIPDVAFAMSRLHYATSDSTMIAGMTFGEPRPILIANERFAENLAESATPVGAEPPAGAAPAQKPLKPGPVSVFISRKEGRLFVRQGFAPVFDARVTFDHPERPLGTHVFSACAVASEANAVRWTMVSIPSATATSSAADALERISIPPDAVERISDLMSPGASLVISDQGLGPETGVGTDFITIRDRASEIAAQRLADLLVLRELDRPLRTDEAAVWLREELGVPISPGQLANLRVIGGGPAFQHAGRYVTYTKAALAAYAKERLGGERRSTSQGTGKRRATSRS
jgi:hypothetical protein